MAVLIMQSYKSKRKERDKMKTRLKIWSLALLGVLLGSCHGQTDDEVEVQLVPSQTTINADGEQSVSFQVLYGASDVTVESNIYLTSHPELGWSGNSFSTTEAGTYKFQAVYRDQPSQEVEITALAVEKVESRFERHICVMDLTGTWCSFCPEGYRKLNYYVTRPYWKDVVHMLAIHDNTSGEDPMGLPLASTLLNDFKLVGFPSFITDLRDSGSLTDNVDDIEPSFERSEEQYPACSDVKIATSLSGTSLSVDVTLFAEMAGEWRTTVFLVEDGIVAPQADGSMITEDYTHNHVARQLLSISWRGEGLGQLSAESEGSKSYTATLAEDWVAEKMYVMALAIDSDGYVNNVAVCPLGESVDYKYLN